MKIKKVSPRTGRVGRPLQQCEHCPFCYELNWQKDMKTRNQIRRYGGTDSGFVYFIRQSDFL